jgi:PHD/YefM family antitoxin component YafN of YafNO toxin-antitoxin module
LSLIPHSFIAGRQQFPPADRGSCNALDAAGGNGLIKRTLSRTFSAVTSILATHARLKLCQLLDEAAESHEPIKITGKRANGILISEDDWRSIQETLYLLSIPGMRESIRKGMKEPLEKSSATQGW